MTCEAVGRTLTGKRQSAQTVKAAAESFLVDLYSLREVISLVSRKYFDGQPVLFSDAARDLDQLIGETEELVTRFNSDFAKGTGIHGQSGSSASWFRQKCASQLDGQCRGHVEG